MNIWEAIKEMRKRSKENRPFSFSYMSYNSTSGTSEGIVYVRKARCLKRESARHNRHAEDMERYINLDTGQARHFWQPLLMTFEGEKITV